MSEKCQIAGTHNGERDNPLMVTVFALEPLSAEEVTKETHIRTYFYPCHFGSW